MASFKEYNNNTFYAGPDGIPSNRGSSDNIYEVLYVKYANYPPNSSSGLVWFGLKQDNNFKGVLAQNIDYSNGFNFTSSHSDCWAKIGPNNTTWSPDSNTGMDIKFVIGKSDVYREITFKWKDFVVFKFIQYAQKNKLLICKPIWNIDPDTITSNTTIGFSTSSEPTSIRPMAFVGHGGNNLKKLLCAIEQLNNPHTTTWVNMQLQDISSLKYIRGTNYKTNGMGDYWLTDVIVDTGNEIIRDNFDKIKELDILYIFVTRSGNGDYVCVGNVNMSENREYMLAEIG